MQVLTLANGDRILMTPQMKAMFETENLNNASPATVSRAGIIYVSHSELGWAPIVASWLQKRSPQEASALRSLFETFVDPMLDFVRSGSLSLRSTINSRVLFAYEGPQSSVCTQLIGSHH